MFVLDMPEDIPFQTPTVMLAENSQAGYQNNTNVQRTAGVCKVIDTAFHEHGLGFAASAISYISQFEGVPAPAGGWWTVEKSAKTTVLENPKHGKFSLEYGYVPEAGYFGEDMVSAEVEILGYKVKVMYYLKIVDSNNLPEDPRITDPTYIEFDHSIEGGFCTPDFWKISSSNWYETSSLQILLAGASDALTGFSDLSGATLGQTSGNKITLDTDAAGYTWFVDYTPYLNEEWLPTSNPYEWKAKPGSEAEGKMDLLSVLLHEYGHVLGIEHSADSHDAMSAILQPGVRRLPDVEAWLVLPNQRNGVLAASQNTAPPLIAGEPVTVTTGLSGQKGSVSFGIFEQGIFMETQ